MDVPVIVGIYPLSFKFSRWGKREETKILQLCHKVLLFKIEYAMNIDKLTFKFSTEKHISYIVITFYLWVFLLSPLRNKCCDFTMTLVPEVLHSQSNASTREKYSQTMPWDKYNREAILIMIPHMTQYNIICIIYLLLLYVSQMTPYQMTGLMPFSG